MLIGLDLALGVIVVPELELGIEVLPGNQDCPGAD